MKVCRNVVLCLFIIVIAGSLSAQESRQDESFIQLPKGFENSISKKATKLDDQLGKQSSKYLNQLSRREERLLE